LAKGRDCDLLDVGCGPATLGKLLNNNIHYYGMDIAIHNPSPNLLEMDISQNVIRFGDKTFDLIMAGGFFEYMGGLQRIKLSEIQRILKKDGKFVVTFLNFSHLNDRLCDNSIYNNIQGVQDFERDLEMFFKVDRWFTSSLNWHRSEPRRKFLRKLEMPLAMNIPILSSKLAVDYIFICSQKT
jgi:SAM-dependent methyltransferase